MSLESIDAHAVVALLSNVNVAPVAGLLADKGIGVWMPDGYGDVIGALADPESGLASSGAEAIFLIFDASALFAACRSKQDVFGEIGGIFGAIRANLPGSADVFVSDIVCRYDPYCGDGKSDPSREAEAAWLAARAALAADFANVYLFPYAALVLAAGGESFYSEKMWYLARMPHTSVAHRAIARQVADCALSYGPAKKVLAIDLDNTIWGGVVGELGPQGIELSDEHAGLAYKEAQRELLNMKDAGVVLAVVSKNNRDDGMAPFKANGHMVLQEGDVSAFRLNWERKDGNLRDIASALNLGIDSFAFLDDNPAERELVVSMLPEVAVVDFPDDVADLPATLRRTYRELFWRRAITREDRGKAQQYAAVEKRAALERGPADYESYLRDLDIRIRRVDALGSIARVAQLVTKTNQFNLTTRRHSQAAIAGMAASGTHEVYAFDIADRFGDNGLTAVAIVEVVGASARVDTLVMSCRIMGKHVEDAVMGCVELDLRRKGVEVLVGEYVPSGRNAPAAGFYENLGYRRIADADGGVMRYALRLDEAPERAAHVRRLQDGSEAQDYRR